jgi:hypothetical protein
MGENTDREDKREKFRGKIMRCKMQDLVRHTQTENREKSEKRKNEKKTKIF